MAGGEAFWAPLPLAGTVQSVVAGDNVTVDDTDPANPVVSSSTAATAVRDAGRWEVVVSGSAPPVAVTNEALTDWVYGWISG